MLNQSSNQEKETIEKNSFSFCWNCQHWFRLKRNIFKEIDSSFCYFLIGFVSESVYVHFFTLSQLISTRSQIRVRERNSARFIFDSIRFNLFRFWFSSYFNVRRLLLLLFILFSISFHLFISLIFFVCLFKI